MGRSPFFAVFVLVSVISALAKAAGQEKHEPAVCSKPPCVIVTVDKVSKASVSDQKTGKPIGTVIDVTVSSSKDTYLLTCTSKGENCFAPTENANYEFVESGAKLALLKDFIGEYTHEKTVFLGRGGESFGLYWLVAHVPIPASEVQTLIKECKAKDRWLNDDKCAVYLSKKEQIRTMPCPDSDAAIGCRSFQELLAADDSELMDDLATKEHVYICFRPKQDVFLDIYFAEPNESGWEKATAQEQLKGASPTALLQFSGAGIAYYKEGIGDSTMSFHNIGKWAFEPLSRNVDASTLATLATSSNSVFEGEDPDTKIRIEQSRLAASEKFKNKAGSITEHSVILQLATGRFTEMYQETSGKTLDTFSGRCLVVPTATR